MKSQQMTLIETLSGKKLNHNYLVINEMSMRDVKRDPFRKK